MTVDEAKAYLKVKAADGVLCPCCGQFVKVYPRPITGSMAYTLILIYRYFQKPIHEDWLHVANYIHGLGLPANLYGGDFAKLRHWGLIEQKDGERDDGSNRIGYYRITEKGKQFVLGKATVPARARIFNKKCYSLTGKEISIRQALGKKFNYEELMKG